jgi:hypothetical protein
MKRSLSLFLVTIAVTFGLVFISHESQAQNIGSLKQVVTPGFSFRKDLKIGDTDPDVRELQRVLNADIDTMISGEEAGSRGKETTYFGNLTKQAVIKFQNKYKDIVLTLNSITVADGVVNKPTRTRLNLLIDVINTYDSVGFPQSYTPATTVSAPVVVVAPTPVVNSTGVSMPICQFVNLLASIQAIDSARANTARNIYGCTSAPSLRPSVSIEANNKGGTLTIDSPRNVTLSWTSENVTFCTSGGGSKPLSGSQRVYVSSSGTYPISCTGPNGTATDSVVIRLSNEDDDEEDEQEDEDDEENQSDNTTTPIASTTNKVLSLSGDADDMVSIKQSSSLNLNTNMTLEAWVNPSSWKSNTNNASTTENVIISKGRIDDNLEYALSLDKGKLVYSNSRSMIWTTDPVVALNKWTHVTVTTDDTNGVVTLYVDNVKITNTKTGPRVSGGPSTFNQSNSITEATSTAQIGNVYIGNFNKKYCDSQVNNGFAGKIDDVRIWNKTRTESEIVTNMNKSVKDSVGLVGYYTFDNSSAVDITSSANNGYIKGGANSVVDNTSPSVIVSAPSLFTFTFNPDNSCEYRMPELDLELDDLATTTEEELPDPKTDVSGIVTRVTKCLASPGEFDLTEVEIQPCGPGQNVQRYEPDASGNMLPSGSFSGNIFITLRNNVHQPPTVGDTILARVVPDAAGTCSALVGGVPPSTYSYEGIITGQYSSAPDTTGACSVSGGTTGGNSTGSSGMWIGAGIGTIIAPGVGTVVGGFIGSVGDKLKLW